MWAFDSMRVLLIHNRYRSGAPGGEDVVFDAERRLLSQAGHDVVVYSRSNDELSENRWSDRFQAALDVYGSERTRSDLREIIRRFKPDVAHIHNAFPLITSSAYDACREARLPLVQTVHNFRMTCSAATHFRDGRLCQECDVGRALPAIRYGCFGGSRFATAAIVLMRSRVYRAGVGDQAVSRFIALTHFAAERLLAAGVPRDRIIVRPNFVEIGDATSLHLRSAEETASRYAVFSGRLSEEKGLMTVLRAWKNPANLQLKVIGDGPLRAEAERFAKEERLDVEFVGTLPRPAALRLVAGATLQIVPSLWFEGMPLVILEAWALGVPVIGSRLGGIAEMLGEGEFGLVFDPGNPVQLRQKVAELLSTSDLSASIRARASRRYRDFHTPERGLASLLEVYRSAVSPESSIG
jgi:glycosyltransferase involved in cell wall biosynthesis